jgi:hypothetical protein
VTIAIGDAYQGIGIIQLAAIAALGTVPGELFVNKRGSTLSGSYLAGALSSSGSSLRRPPWLMRRSFPWELFDTVH